MLWEMTGRLEKGLLPSHQFPLLELRFVLTLDALHILITFQETPEENLDSLMFLGVALVQKLEMVQEKDLEKSLEMACIGLRRREPQQLNHIIITRIRTLILEALLSDQIPPLLRRLQGVITEPVLLLGIISLREVTALKMMLMNIIIAGAHPLGLLLLLPETLVYGTKRKPRATPDLGGQPWKGSLKLFLLRTLSP